MLRSLKGWSFEQWNLGGDLFVMGMVIPVGYAVWYPEGVHGVIPDAVLCIFSHDDEEWTDPIRVWNCASLTIAHSIVHEFVTTGGENA